MNEPKTSGDSLSGADEKRRSELDSKASTWKLIRFIEIFFVVGCMALLMASYVTNPTHDDYTRFCEGLAKPLRVPKSRRLNDSVSERTELSVTTSAPPADLLGLHTFPFKLSYAIVLFTLTTTVLLVLLLDCVSRFVGEPINTLPMIVMLSTCEAFSLTTMIMTADMFLDSMNGLLLTASGLTVGLSICFATDIVYTSVKGNVV